MVQIEIAYIVMPTKFSATRPLGLIKWTPSIPSRTADWAEWKNAFGAIHETRRPAIEIHRC